MLCALAYISVLVGRVPIVLFLKYDPKDVVIVIGGLIYGPLTSFAVTVIVSVVQMVTISGTGIFGCMMNMISSCSFACTAAWIYKPVVTVLRRSDLIEWNHDSKKVQINIGVLLAALLIIITCILWILCFKNVIYTGGRKD